MLKPMLCQIFILSSIVFAPFFDVSILYMFVLCIPNIYREFNFGKGLTEQERIVFTYL